MHNFSTVLAVVHQFLVPLLVTELLGSSPSW